MMNSLLRRVARELRYRPLPELIGTSVTIEAVERIPNVVGAAVSQFFPSPIRFMGPDEPWLTIALAKYCHLDLTFTIDGIEWLPGDCLGTSTLKEFGFAFHPADLPEDQRQSIEQNNDPTCIVGRQLLFPVSDNYFSWSTTITPDAARSAAAAAEGRRRVLGESKPGL